MTKKVIGPKSKKQQMFINSSANVTVFGGAAGAGKTFLGVLDFAKYIQYPNFRGIITRRTTPQLKGPGGVYDKAISLFREFDKKVQWKEKDGKFVFSSGAQLYLKHFESEESKVNFDGAEVNEILVDEGQQFSEDMVTYLMSRMRNPTCPEVNPHMKITCNPLKTSFLRKWVDWYLIQEGEMKGRPDPDKSGVIRWFVRRDGDMYWADSREELIERFGPKALPLSFTFIDANVYDNPVVMEINPEYVTWLESLKRVEKERLLYGNWDANEEASGYFKREWVQTVKVPPENVVQRVRAWDLAGSIPSESNKNPDWTVGLLMSKTKDGKYYIEDVQRFQARFGEVLDRVIKQAHDDGDDISISLPREPGQAGQQAAAQFIARLSEEGFHARARPTNKSKVLRFAPFAAIAEQGFVYVVENPTWNEKYFNELELFDGGRDKKDDQVDATSDAYQVLAQNLHIPLMDLPDFHQTSPFSNIPR